MSYGILVAMETKKKKKKDFDFKSGRRLDKCLISVILYQQNYSCVEKEYSELLFLTKNSSFLQNRHFPVAMVTEWNKGELSNVFLWSNLS